MSALKALDGRLFLLLPLPALRPPLLLLLPFFDPAVDQPAVTGPLLAAAAAFSLAFLAALLCLFRSTSDSQVFIWYYNARVAREVSYRKNYSSQRLQHIKRIPVLRW